MPLEKTIRSTMEASPRSLAAPLTAAFCFCVFVDFPTVAAAASLISLQHATVSFDGTGKPATNQDKCYDSHKTTVLIGGCSLEK